jgi:hypothetical protein
MATYTVDVTINETYQFDDVLNAEEAIKIAKNCIRDNFKFADYDDTFISYNAVRTDIPQAGDATDAGIAGE